MSSKMHRATTAAPELEKVLEETQRSPFTARLSAVHVRYVNKVKLVPYNGFTDPKIFLKSMCIAINRAHFTVEESDAGINSINYYRELTAVFQQHHSVFMIKEAMNADLWTMSQKESEPLRTFIERFKKVVSNIAITDDAAIGALQNALLFRSRFREDLIIARPSTLDDALHRANRYIEIEEEKAALVDHQPKASNLKDKAREDHYEPRQHYDREYAKNDKGKKNSSFAINGQDPKSNTPWNKYYRDTDSKRSYCEFHKFAGHSTDDCRQLQLLLLSKFKNGSIEVEHDQRKRNDRERNEEPNQLEQARRAIQKLPGPPKRNHDAPRQDDPLVPRRKIHMIMGGLTICQDSVRSIKNYRRQAEVQRDWIASSTPAFANTDPITFTEADASSLTGPHNDPLVVELMIGESTVTKVLIDTCSSVNVIFKDVLIQMEVDLRTAEQDVQPLTGFDGDTVITVETIMLPIYVGGAMNCFNFAIVDKPIIYNVTWYTLAAQNEGLRLDLPSMC
ncbi:uncharacterized protein LOC110226534 [Arabidopsis lyrata subsp. lyrata]|uniref:uncharacterized protein LOC110226534 n=1 Tax=Arabidopsis lyrata subsp. lyrata TaxID=81972 RepID=UPI000A29DC78|nr:uncharacterized protein LOC110226534 [Arabidopsis lyrata subsp. lyrata]|eukprot:XP_020874131.1 uncharacterized protein LOC110226534 [Arabidopsis lyrata subsp. lyrata]